MPGYDARLQTLINGAMRSRPHGSGVFPGIFTTEVSALNSNKLYSNLHIPVPISRRTLNGVSYRGFTSVAPWHAPTITSRQDEAKTGS